ncbi:dolichyl-phosphate-mannose--protein mannosyltransferase [Asanoa siamensis]|uniref:Polyprenol-phosphate-mannose--protein mannosyltransferase n=1 Tax=Asanoa siamensis TaxID=926357 RepID=A0ABQ4CQ62_9ACTN|nr:phospholipid carrier-dependent glycosyltransferase [Asanoa siamensis]GIF73453.1 dolichyl-phosphate-mannose--protein mannosyltransferase [Asanoa siamensis]
MRATVEVTQRRLASVDPRGSAASWYATGFVVLVAAVLRFHGLAQPQGKLFDETYYAKDGWGLLTKGVEWNYRDDGPAYVVHPPLGKWLIALGEWAFGYYDIDGDQRLTGHLANMPPEFGWRFSAAVAGTISVLLIVRIGRRLFGSTLLGCAAGLLLALDGFHLVLSRVAMLDIFLLLFVLATFGVLLVDRDHRRAAWLRALGYGPADRPASGPTNGADGPDRLADGAAIDPADGAANGPTDRPADRAADGAEPATGIPWLRLLAALLFGCAVATKWSALFFLPVFALLILWWDAGARRSAGVARPWRETLRRESGWLAACAVVIAAVYLASWSGWLLTDHGYYRHYRADTGRSELPVIGALQNLVHYHQQAFGFHSTLQDKHPSQSWPWQWLLLGKPVTVHLAYPGAPWGTAPVSEIVLLGTPLLWWSFLPTLVASGWLAVARRDWRPAAILLVVAAGLLPWFYYAVDAHRVMFNFYTAPILPFMVLAVVYVLGVVIGPPGPEHADRRLIGAVSAGAYLVLVVLCFAYFHALFVGDFLPYADWADRMWLGSRWHP